MDGVIIFIIVFGSLMSLLFLSITIYFGCGYYCSYKSIDNVEEPTRTTELEEVPLE
jgi:hypothetical protein